MGRIRGRQELKALTLNAATPARSTPLATTRFRRAVGIWIKKRFTTETGVNVGEFISDLNKTIVARGYVLDDGQLLTRPLSLGHLPIGVVDAEPRGLPGYQGFISTKPIKLSGDAEIIFERGRDRFDPSPARLWGPVQRDFFDLRDPYQMAEDPEEFITSHLFAWIPHRYLLPAERITAILHGVTDNYYFYCPCHGADVVFTSRNRLVCMGCGALHAVLARPVNVRRTSELTATQWREYFQTDGSLSDEEIDVSVLDFNQIEKAETIWATSQWEEAKHRFVFFARSPPDVVADAIRGTEADPTIFAEAGWEQLDLTPPPAHQLAHDSVSVDYAENAAHALREGISAFLAGRKRSEHLVNSIPQLFRAIELLLKAKLEQIDPQLLRDKLNNPTVLKRIMEAGVALSVDELSCVNRLRSMRNDLQHGTAQFNHRTGLSVSRRAIVFIDRFAQKELTLWVGDAIPMPEWVTLLAIPEIQATAKVVARERIRRARQNPRASVERCTRCRQRTMLREHPRSGASCVMCGHVPRYSDEAAAAERSSVICGRSD